MNDLMTKMIIFF